MIILVTGKLGAGKTYFAVNYLLKKYYEEDDFFIDPIPKGDVRVITNIEGFKLPHESLDSLVYSEDGLVPDIKKMEQVFSFDFVGGNKNVIYVIDEAQIYFDRKFYSKAVFSFFQKSRHAGVDIILITQDINTLAKEIKVLAEYEVRALQRSVRLRNTFMYQYFIEDEKVKQVGVKFRLAVANMYLSRTKEEKEKVSYVHYKYAAIFIISILGAIGLFKFVMIDRLFANTSKADALARSRAPQAEALSAERRRPVPVSAQHKGVTVGERKVFTAAELDAELERLRKEAGGLESPRSGSPRPQVAQVAGDDPDSPTVARFKTYFIDGVTYYEYK